MSQDVTQDILTQAVEEVIAMFGKVVLAELERKLPLSRQQLRRLQKNDFKLLPNGNSGKKKTATKISPFSGFINSEYLANGIKNSSVIFDTIRKNGYKGGLTAVKDYILNSRNFVTRRAENQPLNGSSSPTFISLPFHEYSTPNRSKMSR